MYGDCMGCMVFMGLHRMYVKYAWDVYIFSGMSVWLAYAGSAQRLYVKVCVEVG